MWTNVTTILFIAYWSSSVTCITFILKVIIILLSYVYSHFSYSYTYKYLLLFWEINKNCFTSLFVLCKVHKIFVFNFYLIICVRPGGMVHSNQNVGEKYCLIFPRVSCISMTVRNGFISLVFVYSMFFWLSRGSEFIQNRSNKPKNYYSRPFSFNQNHS